MSMHYQRNGSPEVLEYKDGRTKQAFRNETDINKILAKAQKTGVISHMAKHQPQYGDFAEFDFLEVQTKLAEGRQMFAELPSEIRSEFNQDPAEFFDFVNDPENADRLPELLPALAQPGRQNIQPDAQLDPPADDPPEVPPEADPVPDPPPA